MICHIKVKGGCLVIGHAFDGKVVLITGASRGIGRALAIQLAERGAKVVINYRKNQDEAKAVAQKICELGSEALLCQADMEHEEQIQSMFAEISRKYGRLDIFVANAAATAFKPLMEVKAHHIRRTFAISVDGFIFAVQQAVPLMKEGGRIVGVSGFDSIRYLQNHGVLGAAKAALEGLVRYWACELALKNINVNGVCPGYVETDSAKVYSGDNWEKNVAQWSEKIPKGRLASPDEVASVIRFFCSPSSEYVTGQTLVVDDGMTIT
jgi:enoyl-[acyl-carrier protein] reductase III